MPPWRPLLYALQASAIASLAFAGTNESSLGLSLQGHASPISASLNMTLACSNATAGTEKTSRGKRHAKRYQDIPNPLCELIDPGPSYLLVLVLGVSSRQSPMLRKPADIRQNYVDAIHKWYWLEPHGPLRARGQNGFATGSMSFSHSLGLESKDSEIAVAQPYAELDLLHAETAIARIPG